MIRTYLYLLSFALILASCGSTPEESVQNDDQPVTVVLSQPAALEGNSLFTASGKLVAKNSVNVSTRMMGYITGMQVQVGQQVSAGQLLVTINSQDLQAKKGQVQAQIAMAEANYNNAKKDYERFQNLFNTESASQKELDDMTTRFESAKAGLDAARQMEKEVNSQFSYTNVTAPISGTVTAKFAEQGDMANPGMPLLTIESPSRLQAQVMVTEKNITQIKQGAPVKVDIKSADKTVDGKVTEISKSSTGTGGQYLVKINIDHTENLLPGMFVNVAFPISPKVSTQATVSNIMVPDSALVKKGQLTGIYVVSEENTAILRWLKTGKQVGNDIEVLSGLRPDESYIVSAERRLYNGVKVIVK